MVLSALKNVFHLNNIHHCLCVFQLFSMKNINLFANWLKWDFYTRTIYTWVFFNFFYWRLPLCELTIMVFPTLKHFFNPKNIHLSKLMFSTLKFPPAPPKKILLCASVWLKNIYLCASWCFLHLKTNFYPKNIHLCASWQEWYFLHKKNVFYLNNIHLCASVFPFFQGRKFTSVWVD